MKFFARKRRQPPAVIIISLIDILIVLLIFMMVTTTFKQQPLLKLAMPESSQAKPGVTENPRVEVTIDRRAVVYIGTQPIALDRLGAELTRRAAANPALRVAIRTDKDTPIGQVLRVMDAAKAAKIKDVHLYAKSPGQP